MHGVGDGEQEPRDRFERQPLLGEMDSGPAPSGRPPLPQRVWPEHAPGTPILEAIAMSVAEFFKYLFVYEPSSQLAVQLAEAYGTRVVAERERTTRAPCAGST